MEDKKQNGSYYTSPLLADFLIKHIFEHYNLPTKLKILEPSCGDGIFVNSLLENRYIDSTSEITLVEKNIAELEKSVEIVNLLRKDVKINSYNSDFLDFQKEISEDYNLIIGNPPYIKKNLLSKEQIDSCLEIHKNADLSPNSIKNIWTSFLLSSIKILDKNGLLCLILPAELLQVQYTKELRKYLLDNFERIEIFAFNELVFKQIEQDVIVLIGARKTASKEKDGISFYQVNKLIDLEIPQYVEKNSNVHRKTLDKWTNYLLEDNELNFIDQIRSYFKPITNYCEKINPGVVTAANSYFIVDDSTIKKYNLDSFSMKILSKGINIQKILDLSNDVVNNLHKRNNKINLIALPNCEIENINEGARKYIELGESLGIDKRYKCKQRTNWYSVPCLLKCDGFFVKRTHKFPRLIVNSAKIEVTDSFYRIIMKKEYEIEKLVFSFYNSLTLLLAELEGRYYGGGVLELTPNEFKKLSISYYENMSNDEFVTLNNMFKNDEPINNILDYTDTILLKENIGLESQQIEKLKSIREKLVARRLKMKN